MESDCFIQHSIIKQMNIPFTFWHILIDNRYLNLSTMILRECQERVGYRKFIGIFLPNAKINLLNNMISTTSSSNSFLEISFLFCLSREEAQMVITCSFLCPLHSNFVINKIYFHLTRRIYCHLLMTFNNNCLICLYSCSNHYHNEIWDSTY